MGRGTLEPDRASMIPHSLNGYQRALKTLQDAPQRSTTRPPMAIVHRRPSWQWAHRASVSRMNGLAATTMLDLATTLFYPAEQTWMLTLGYRQICGLPQVLYTDKRHQIPRKENRQCILGWSWNAIIEKVQHRRRPLTRRSGW